MTNKAHFKVLAKDSKSKARAGTLQTPHGDVETPVFMPVATQASVKAISQEDLATLGVKAILANSYHLYLRPGAEVIRKAGGLHRFMNYDGMILTDSGGFQVWSLTPLRKITDDGVAFRSHLNGSSHILTAEKVIQIQADLGSDCWTALDVCAPHPSTEAEALEALRLTMAWADRTALEIARQRDAGRTGLFFPILQGSFFPHLRKQAAEHLQSLPLDGIAIGGLSVGEPKPLMWETLNGATDFLAEDKARYLMGVGTPDDLWDATALGVDMMDCVFPTRVARNGAVFTNSGPITISNSPFREDFGPLDPECGCFVCRTYTRAYLAHLLRAKELAIYRLLSYHNLHFMAKIAADIRKAILDERFTEARKDFKARYIRAQRPEPKISSPA